MNKMTDQFSPNILVWHKVTQVGNYVHVKFNIQLQSTDKLVS